LPLNQFSPESAIGGATQGRAKRNYDFLKVDWIAITIFCKFTDKGETYYEALSEKLCCFASKYSR
jgi:hypothetical protein